MVVTMGHLLGWGLLLLAVCIVALFWWIDSAARLRWERQQRLAERLRWLEFRRASRAMTRSRRGYWS